MHDISTSSDNNICSILNVYTSIHKIRYRNCYCTVLHNLFLRSRLITYYCNMSFVKTKWCKKVESNTQYLTQLLPELRSNTKYSQYIKSTFYYAVEKLFIDKNQSMQVFWYLYTHTCQFLNLKCLLCNRRTLCTQ